MRRTNPKLAVLICIIFTFSTLAASFAIPDEADAAHRRRRRPPIQRFFRGVGKVVSAPVKAVNHLRKEVNKGVGKVVDGVVKILPLPGKIKKPLKKVAKIYVRAKLGGRIDGKLANLQNKVVRKIAEPLSKPKVQKGIKYLKKADKVLSVKQKIDRARGQIREIANTVSGLGKEAQQLSRLGAGALYNKGDGVINSRQAVKILVAGSKLNRGTQKISKNLNRVADKAKAGNLIKQAGRLALKIAEGAVKIAGKTAKMAGKMLTGGGKKKKRTDGKKGSGIGAKIGKVAKEAAKGGLKRGAKEGAETLARKTGEYAKEPVLKDLNRFAMNELASKYASTDRRKERVDIINKFLGTKVIDKTFTKKDLNTIFKGIADGKGKETLRKIREKKLSIKPAVDIKYDQSSKNRKDKIKGRVKDAFDKAKPEAKKAAVKGAKKGAVESGVKAVLNIDPEKVKSLAKKTKKDGKELWHRVRDMKKKLKNREELTADDKKNIQQDLATLVQDIQKLKKIADEAFKQKKAKGKQKQEIDNEEAKRKAEEEAKQKIRDELKKKQEKKLAKLERKKKLEEKCGKGKSLDASGNCVFDPREDLKKAGKGGCTPGSCPDDQVCVNHNCVTREKYEKLTKLTKKHRDKQRDSLKPGKKSGAAGGADEAVSQDEYGGQSEDTERDPDTEYEDEYPPYYDDEEQFGEGEEDFVDQFTRGGKKGRRDRDKHRDGDRYRDHDRRDRKHDKHAKKPEIKVPFQGTTSGSWGGTCNKDTVSGNFSMTFSTDGSVKGSFSGDDEGSLTGKVNADGKVHAGGGAAGEGCKWTGTVTQKTAKKLSGSGNWHCDAECNGGWKGK